MKARLINGFLLALLIISPLAHSAAILQILPTRVVFDDNKRSADVFLKNRGDNDGEYRISLRNQRMTEDGRFEIIEKGQKKDNELTAEKLIRYAPRRVSISKNLADDAQTIRLALRKPKNLADGEYRTHLLFSSMPKSDGSEINNISIFAKVEISIPVIVRHGDLTAKVSIEKASVQKIGNDTVLTFQLNRDGTRSIYGDVLVTQKRGGTDAQLAFMSGMSVYMPNERRIIQVPLNGYDASTPLNISFTENPTYGGTESASFEMK